MLLYPEVLNYKFIKVQFKIPQDVQLEDKIVGPLTLKQLGICSVGGVIAYFFYVTLAKNYFWEVWLLPVALTTLITLAIAFVKISNVTFTKFILLLTEYGLKSRKRSWQKGDGIIYPSIFHPMTQSEKKDKEKIVKKVQSSKKSFEEISQISKILDTNIQVN